MSNKPQKLMDAVRSRINTRRIGRQLNAFVTGSTINFRFIPDNATVVVPLSKVDHYNNFDLLADQIVDEMIEKVQLFIFSEDDMSEPSDEVKAAIEERISQVRPIAKARYDREYRRSNKVETAVMEKISFNARPGKMSS